MNRVHLSLRHAGAFLLLAALALPALLFPGRAAGDGQIIPYVTPGAQRLTIGANLAIKGPRPHYDVTAYPGVDSTGATSSSAGIQAVIDAAYAAGGGRVFCPPGSYLITTALRVKSKVQLVGAGQVLTTLKSDKIVTSESQTSGFDSVVIVGGGGNSEISYDTAVSDLTLAYTTPHTARLAAGGVACLRLSKVVRAVVERITTRSGQGGINVNRGHDVRVQHCSIYEPWTDGINVDNGSTSDPGVEVGVDDVRIVENYFENSHDDAISVLSRATGVRKICSDVTVSRNIIQGTLINGGGVGIYGVQRGLVEGNQIHNTVSHGIAVHSYRSISSYRNEDVTVRGNLITSDLAVDPTEISTSTAGIYLGERGGGTPSGSDELAASKRLVCEGNTISVTDRSGIATYNHPSRLAYRTAECVVRDNTIHFEGGAACPVDYRGLYLKDITGWLIEGNKIDGFPSCGLQLRTHVRSRVTRNEVRDCVMAPAYAAHSQVLIGDELNAADALESFVGNVVSKETGAAGALVHLTDTGGVDGIPGNYEYRENRVTSPARSTANAALGKCLLSVGRVRQVTPSVRTEPGRGVASPLYAYFRFEEASGARADALGNLSSWTANNAPGNTASTLTGIGGSRLQLNGTNQDLFRAGGFALDGYDWTVAVWVRADNLTGIRPVFAQINTAELGINLDFDGTNFRFGLSPNGTSFTYATAVVPGGAQVGTDYLLVATRNSLTGQHSLRVNRGNVATATLAGAPFQSAANTYIGRNAGSALFWSGSIGPFMLYRSLPGQGGCLGSAESAALYARGAGYAPV